MTTFRRIADDSELAVWLRQVAADDTRLHRFATLLVIQQLWCAEIDAEVRAAMTDLGGCAE